MSELVAAPKGSVYRQLRENPYVFGLCAVSLPTLP